MREGETYGSWVWAAESPRGATDQDGRVPKSAAQSSVGLKYLYASRPWSPVAEAYHNRARWYSPEAGRFLTRDPIEYLGGVNQYMYANGNPIGFRDPWGLLQTDKEGNLKFDWLSPMMPYADGVFGEWGYLYADDGTPILAFRIDLITQMLALASMDEHALGVITNCHGTTFANGEYWINPGQVKGILDGDGYSKISNSAWSGGPRKKTAIVVWQDYAHTETVAFGSQAFPIYGLAGREINPRTRDIRDRLQRPPFNTAVDFWEAP